MPHFSYFESCCRSVPRRAAWLTLFDKRAKVRKVHGSADLLLDPLFVRCPICAAVVSLGHFNGIMIERDNLWQHIKSSHADDPVRSRYRGMLGIGIYILQCLILVEY